MSNGNEFAHIPTADLERQLRQGQLDPQLARRTEAELIRRFQTEFSEPGNISPPPPRPFSPPAPGDAAASSMPQQRRPRSKAASSVISLVIVAGVVLGLVMVLNGAFEPDPVPQSTYCYTPVGWCNWTSSPIGAGCGCTNEFGVYYSGTIG